MMGKHALYLYRKLIGSGFSFSIFMLSVFIMVGFDVYEMTETAQNIWVWVAFYPYAIIISYLVDILTSFSFFNIQASRYRALIVYQIFGFIPFVFLYFPSLSLIIITGIVGALSASLFFAGIEVIFRYQKFAILLAVLFPLFMTVLAQMDFTIEKNWRDTTSNASYEAHVDYFNGEHRLPVSLEKGDVFRFFVNVHPENAGGYAVYIETPDNHSMEVEFEENKEEKIYYFTAKETADYYFVLTGSRFKGNFLIDWENNENNKEK